MCPIYGLFFWYLSFFACTRERKQVELTGAEIFVRSLEEQGIKHVFGYPGGAVVPI